MHVEQPGTGNGILTEDPSVAGLISRADVAALVSDQISGYSQKDPFVPLFLVICGCNWIYRHTEVDELTPADCWMWALTLYFFLKRVAIAKSIGDSSVDTMCAVNSYEHCLCLLFRTLWQGTSNDISNLAFGTI